MSPSDEAKRAGYLTGIRTGFAGGVAFSGLIGTSVVCFRAHTLFSGMACAFCAVLALLFGIGAVFIKDVERDQ